MSVLSRLLRGSVLASISPSDALEPCRVRAVLFDVRSQDEWHTGRGLNAGGHAHAELRGAKDQ